ncbi:MAG TPA: alpha/beta hydrolase [Dongiaceae bacterium]|jgi:acetyl esterase/lipase|nr:alpha/beta hydrolase [Dongiaceae bacterium]
MAKISLFRLLPVLLFPLLAGAQTNDTFPLWPNDAPGAVGNDPKDIPTLRVYLPDPTNATGAAMVICAGGGYAGLARHEGHDYALWLNRMGIAGFVLKYRLGMRYHHPAMLEDVTRALRTVRARAVEWNVDPHRIGIIGSSAGGHLASTLLTHYDAGDATATDPIERVSSRPDLGVLCYAVITMGDFTHAGSKMNLLGTNPPPELVQELSNELHVTTNTPPCFIWGTADDTVVPIENSLNFAAALHRENVPFELHVYQHGNHGLGLGAKPNEPEKYLPWVAACGQFLTAHGFTTPAAAK